MLTIRLQRTGRKGHAQFRVVVQDSHQSPSSGKYVALLGSYNPHTKVARIDKDRAGTFLKNGAHPSDRVARLLTTEGVVLPDWVVLSDPQKRTIRNPEKLRKNRSAGTEPELTKEVPAEAALKRSEPKPIAKETPVLETEVAPEEPTQKV